MQRIGETPEFEKITSRLETLSQALEDAAEIVRDYRERHNGNCFELCHGSGKIDVNGLRVQCPLKTFPDACPIVLGAQKRLADAYLRDVGLGMFTSANWPLIETKLRKKGIEPIDVKALLERMRQEDKGAFLMGKTGIGKTFAIAKIIWLLRYEFNLTPFYVSSSIRDLSVEELARKDWLFWDEFGYMSAEWYWDKTLEIVAARYAAGKLRHTVFATNLTPQQLKEHYATLRKITDGTIVINLYKGDK